MRRMRLAGRGIAGRRAQRRTTTAGPRGPIAAALLTLAVLAGPATSQARVVENAVADLSAWAPARDGHISLHGEWAVAWQRFVDPAKLDSAAAVRALPERVSVPDFGNTEAEGAPATLGQYATYALVLDFGAAAATGTPTAPRPLVLELGQVYNTARVYIDGALRARVGEPGRQAETNPHFGNYIRLTVQPPASGKMVLVVHRANHNHLKPGILGRPSLATVDGAVQHRFRTLLASAPGIGGGLIMAVIFLGLFTGRRGDGVYLWFAVSVFVFLLGYILTSDMPKVLGFRLPKEPYLGLVYSLIAVSVPLFYQLHRAVFPQVFPRWPTGPLWVAAGIGLVVIPATSTTGSHAVGQVAQLVSVLVLLGMLAIAGLACLGRKRHAWVAAAAVGLYAAAVAHDIAYFQGLIPQIVELRPLGLLALLLVMALSLSARYAATFSHIHSLTGRLRALNADLEQRVAQRSQELEASNSDLLAAKEASEATLHQLQRAQAQLRESLAYGRRMQRAALPAAEPARYGLGDLAVWWQPREAVGGDSYVVMRRGAQAAIMLIDCTGHGVPGAMIGFMAQGAAEDSLAAAAAWAPPAILADMDGRLRTRLHRTGAGDEAAIDDGCQAGLAVLDTASGEVAFAGVGIDLLLAGPDGTGYRRSQRGGLGYAAPACPRDLGAATLAPGAATTLAMATDGVSAQPGDPGGRPLGRSGLLHRLAAARRTTPDLGGQAATLRQAWHAWQGQEPQRDDLTLILWRLAGDAE